MIGGAGIDHAAPELAVPSVVGAPGVQPAGRTANAVWLAVILLIDR